MTFRGRLRVFFAIIVIVPMIAIAVSLFSLTASSETGKADAGLATALTVAFSLYDEGRIAARSDLRQIAADPQLSSALARGDRAGVARRLRGIVERDPQIVSATIALADEEAIRAGSPRGVAPATADLTRTSGGTLGTLSVSVTDAEELAGTTRARTGRELLVLRADRALASTVPSVRTVPEGSADFDAGGREYRGRREPAQRARGSREELAVFMDAKELHEAISDSRLLVGALVLAFLLLALASSVFVVRALQSQIGQFLDAAKRLASGRFDTPVPVQGDDEFSQLGREFNSMSKQLEAKIYEVQRKRRELEAAIRRVGEAFAAGLDRQGIFELAVQNAVHACEAEYGRALPLDTGVFDETEAGVSQPDLAETLKVAERAAFQVTPVTGQELIGPADPEMLLPKQPDSATVERDGMHAIALPLKARLGTRTTAQYLGVISIARRGRPFTTEEKDLLEYLSGQAVISIENADLHETVQLQAITDELTGLSNVRQLHEALDREFERGRRFDTPIGFVLLDLDNFKNINDTYGHLQGDEVLVQVAGVLRELSRDIDEPARYGGEEMAVVLPQTDVVGAAMLAERMREAIERLRIPRLDGQGDLEVTASFGVASVPSSASDKGSLVAASDDALYRAKRAGKNRVERADAVTA